MRNTAQRTHSIQASMRACVSIVTLFEGLRTTWPYHCTGPIAMIIILACIGSYATVDVCTETRMNSHKMTM